ncbi:MAG: ADOP family duplicated permease [Gemmatimonadales bacterium]
MSGAPFERPEPSRRDVDDELALHLELRTAELIEEGLSPDEARAEALRLFGDPASRGAEVHRIDRREAWRRRWRGIGADWLGDLRHAGRAVARRPLFAAAAVAILTVGIGANTAVFSLVNAVLLDPLPYAEPDRLLSLSSADAEGTFQVSEQERLRYRSERQIFSGVGTWTFGPATIQGDGEPERIEAAYLDAATFAVAGLELVAGRPFTEAEDAPGADLVVVVTEGYARRRLGGVPSAVGRELLIGGRPLEVVGVLAGEVRLPGDFAGPPSEVYLPLGLDPASPDPRNIHYLAALARLAPGVDRAAAVARLGIVARELEQSIAALPDEFRIEAIPVREEVLGPFRTGAVLLLAAVALLLLLACTNIAGLLLAHTEARHQEYAVRAALGAGAGRLARHVLAESTVIAALGGLGGLALGYLALRGLVAASPPSLPRIGAVGMDWRVVLFGMAATGLAATLAGSIPALRLRHRELASVLRSDGRGLTGGRVRHRVRRMLVMGEVALAISIAAGAGLVLMSWRNVTSVSPGFEIGGALTAQLSLPAASYPDRETRWRYYRDLLARLDQASEVEAAGVVSALPLDSPAGDWGFLIEGRPPVPDGERKPFADRYIVSAGYFEAMRVPLLEGRTLSPTDDAEHPPVVLLNRAVADRYWPNGGALGARIRLSTDLDPVWREVVGIVGNVRSRGLEQELRPEFYFPHAQFPASTGGNAVGTMSLVVRSGGDPSALAGTVRAAVRELDPTIPVSRVQTMSSVLESTLSVRRFQALLLGFFAVAGLGLVAIGVYGVIAFLVEERRTEFGLRMALGSNRADVLRLVLADGARLGLPGIALGLLGAVTVGRLLRSTLYGVDALEPWVLVGVAGLVLAVIVGASLTPAIRAARTDPGAALAPE